MEIVCSELEADCEGLLWRRQGVLGAASGDVSFSHMLLNHGIATVDVSPCDADIVGSLRRAVCDDCCDC